MKIFEVTQSINESMSQTDFRNVLARELRIKNKNKNVKLDSDTFQKAYELFQKGVADSPLDAYISAENHMNNMAYESQEDRRARDDLFKNTQAAYNQRIQKGQDTQRQNLGKDTGHSRNTGVDYVDQVNQKKADPRSDQQKKAADDKEINKMFKDKGIEPDKKTSAQARRATTQDLLRGKSRTGRAGDDGDVRTGADGRQLRHDKFYKQDSELGDYDTVLPRLGIKKAAGSVKKYASNFVRDPGATMANLRYKFKDLLQK
jgi:hypothetical protein